MVGIKLNAFQILRNRFACDGKTIAMDKAAVEQCAHQDRHAARFIHVLGHVFTARFEIRDVGRALEDLGDVHEKLAAEYSGEELTVGFNPKYMLELVAQMTDSKVAIGLSGSG